jgi:hypothetical protein
LAYLRPAEKNGKWAEPTALCFFLLYLYAGFKSGATKWIEATPLPHDKGQTCKKLKGTENIFPLSGVLLTFRIPMVANESQPVQLFVRL